MVLEHPRSGSDSPIGSDRKGALHLSASEHLGSGSDPPIGSDRKGVLHLSGIKASQIRLGLANRVGPKRDATTPIGIRHDDI